MMLRRLPLPFGRYPATVGMPFAGCRLFDSHTLGEVSGLIHVFAEIVGHFIAEQLHGRERQKRAERAPRGGNRPQVLHMQIRPRIGQRDDRPSAGTSTIFDLTFGNNASLKARAKVGNSGSIRAMGPCFISPEA